MPSALARLDPGLRNLRLALLAMAATLLSYASALALKHAEHLSLNVVVLAVVLALSLSRTDRASERNERLIAILILLLVAVAASEVGTLLAQHADIGDALYVVAVSGAIWLRRFGRHVAKAGALITLPFVAMLITPGVPGAGHLHVLWAAAVGLIAYFWVAVIHIVAQRTGFVTQPATPPHAPARPQTSAPKQGSVSRRLPASTRMAIQMAVALAAAFAAGRALFGVHWSWLVMTAFIVCSGNRGRGDVLYKSALRIAGAATGTIAATLIAGAFVPRDVASIVVIFIVLGLATWLRFLNYAFWAAGITSVLALLYGYFGETGATLLPHRLESVVIGAAIGIVASWLILPVRTTDVLRRRAADALAALSDVLKAITTASAELEARAYQFERTVTQLDQIAKPLEAHRLLSRIRQPGPHVADTIDAARDANKAVSAIVTASAADPDAPADPAVAKRSKTILRELGATRRALGGRPAEPPTSDHPDPKPPVAEAPLEQALTDLDTAVATFATTVTADLGRSA
jgi:hypothetical protein